ncbi:MAG: 30S ribosomal protein S20 [Alphaproteobacteria bacterium]|jgi:small subunit ribosomal protein S20|nr:30S ribosomal protein S20 [Alphaproteobacteria bacterium]
MASHKSAEKCIRQTARRTLVNQNRMSRIRTFVKKIETLLESKASKVEASTALVQAERELMRGVSKGLLHKNTVARKVSRLAKKVKTLA